MSSQIILKSSENCLKFDLKWKIYYLIIWSPKQKLKYILKYFLALLALVFDIMAKIMIPPKNVTPPKNMPSPKNEILPKNVTLPKKITPP